MFVESVVGNANDLCYRGRRY